MTRATDISVSFVSPTTIQLRLDLGEVRHAVLTDVLPADLGPPDGEGWVSNEGALIGRIGPGGDTWTPVDRYVSSPLDPLFDLRGDPANPYTRIDQANRWSVTIDGEAVEIAGLSRHARIRETAETDRFTFDFATTQTIFIELAEPLERGASFTVDFNRARWEPVEGRYNPQSTVSEAIHVNLTGYDPDDGHKVAYLSSWNGWALDGSGARSQDFGGPRIFRIIDDTSGEIVFEGETTLAAGKFEPTDYARNFAGADVWAMDFSAFDGSGQYHIRVQGVGRSESFKIADGHWDDLFETAFSGFYTQRSGLELTEAHTPWAHPRSLHPEDGRVSVLETTTRLMDTGEGYDTSRTSPFDLLPYTTTGAVLPEAWGGWHDAGDWDRRTQHMEAARKLIELVELAPGWAAAASGNLPESQNRIPDLLDEAIWGLQVFARLQREDGGVRGGIEGGSYPGYGSASWTETTTLYAYAPDVWSSWEFAASAAKLAGALRPYNEKRADRWLDRAEAAMAWAEANMTDADAADRVLNTSRNLAAIELYRVTGDKDWHRLFIDTSSYRTETGDIHWQSVQWEAAFVYSQLDPEMRWRLVAERTFSALADQTEFLLTQGGRSGFGFFLDPEAPYGWGSTAPQPNVAAEFLARMHHLTGDPRYLEAMMSDVQYGLGANPLNMVFLTGLEGARSPASVLNADADALGGLVPPGLTLFGDYSIFDYGRDFYHDIMAEDTWPGVYDTPIHESFQGFSFFVPSTEFTVQQGITDMAFVTGYLAAMASADIFELG